MKTHQMGNPSPELTPVPRKLKLLVTVVNRKKTEFYTDFLQGFEVNFQTVLNAEGTADTETLHMLGLADREKCVILSVVCEDRAAEILDALSEKFLTIKNGKGIAYTVPLSGTIGVAGYRFLSNARV